MIHSRVLPLLPIAIAALCLASEKSERCKYLVEEVSRCQECHTPKLPDGSFDKAKWMKGAVLNIQPIEPVKGWHKTSPDLTPGSRLWERWKEQGLVNYFKTGLTPAGKKADAPMPTYVLTPEDAEAVVEYLKTLK